MSDSAAGPDWRVRLVGDGAAVVDYVFPTGRAVEIHGPLTFHKARDIADRCRSDYVDRNDA